MSPLVFTDVLISVQHYTILAYTGALIFSMKVRTDRSVPYYEGDDNRNVVVLRDILLTYSFYNFDLGYCQVSFHPCKMIRTSCHLSGKHILSFSFLLLVMLKSHFGGSFLNRCSFSYFQTMTLGT